MPSEGEKTIFDHVHDAYVREDEKGHFIRDLEPSDLGDGTAADAGKAEQEHNKANDDAFDKADGTD